jgi:hypothetical protein
MMNVSRLLSVLEFAVMNVDYNEMWHRVTHCSILSGHVHKDFQLGTLIRVGLANNKSL